LNQLSRVVQYAHSLLHKVLNSKSDLRTSSRSLAIMQFDRPLSYMIYYYAVQL